MASLGCERWLQKMFLEPEKNRNLIELTRYSNNWIHFIELLTNWKKNHTFALRIFFSILGSDLNSLKTTNVYLKREMKLPSRSLNIMDFMFRAWDYVYCPRLITWLIVYKDFMYCVITSDCSWSPEGYFYGPDMNGYSTGLSVRQLQEGYKVISADYCVFHWRQKHIIDCFWCIFRF